MHFLLLHGLWYPSPCPPQPWHASAGPGKLYPQKASIKAYVLSSFTNHLMISIIDWGTALYSVPFHSINKSLTLNCHSTQCHWPHTLEEWGCFVGPCMLIHRCTITVFFYPKLIQKIAYSTVPRATFIVYLFIQLSFVSSGFPCIGIPL